MTLSEMLQILGKDIARYGHGHRKKSLTLRAIENIYRHPATAGVIYYRFGQWLYQNRSSLIHFILLGLYYLFYPLVRIYSGMELSPRVQIGAGLCAMHFGPIVIHPDVVAGENLTLLHRVTLGYAKSGIPRIGNNVSIGVGATVIGGISIGDNVSIGAGAVVTRDIPANCTAVGIPAKPISESALSNGPTNNGDLDRILLAVPEEWRA